MLTIQTAETEFWNEEIEEFTTIKPTELQLEHSLVSISKWEQKHCKPFLSISSEKDNKTPEEIIDYIRCMTITQKVNPLVYYALTNENLHKIIDYINMPMTATTISNQKEQGRPNREILTSEVIYYYMFSQGIPIKCEKWHLNRLLMLLQVFAIKGKQQQGNSKMSKKDILSQNAELNKQRRKLKNTRG